MKRIIFIVLIIVVLITDTIKAQQNEVFIYNEGGNTTNYNKIGNAFVVKCSNTSEETALRAYFPRKWGITPLRLFVKTTEDSITTFITNTNANITYSEVLLAADSSMLWGANKLFVKVQPNIGIANLLNANSIPYSNYAQFGSDPNVYLVRLNTTKDMSVVYSNLLFGNDDVVFSQPDFGMLNKFAQSPTPTTNPFYDEQWGLNNTGQYGGIPGYDINAPEAWNFTDGIGIKVAVLDDGIDILHNDLAQNLLPGYDATDNALGGGLFGECKSNDPHGTACAGIIAAADNNIGIKGVAYKSNIIPIRIAYNIVDTFSGGLRWFTYSSWIADAIYKSWHNFGADILSNSWGSVDSLDVIKNEIINANIHGRNGKGCPIIFAAGNYYLNSFYSQRVMDIFPANQKDYVIAVGAASMCGERKDFVSCDLETDWMSCWGPKLSVVAPGVKIFTTDLRGQNGFNDMPQTDPNYYDNDYYATFGGTSAAAPHVAGIAALILSIDPNLTAQQVRYIIENTAQKVRPDLYTYAYNIDYPNGTWNYHTGYGMVDAYNSVKAAKGYDLYISDSPNDGGYNNSNLQTLDSPDIWMRRANDNGTIHQPGGNGTNYLKVRIHNNGPAPSVSGTDVLRVFYKHATLENSMSWNSAQWTACAPVDIPEIPANGSVVLTIPVNFTIGLNNTFEDYAFYVKIDSPFDILSSTETTSLLNNVKYNNNIAAKNVVVSKYLIADEYCGEGVNFQVASSGNSVVTPNLRIRTSYNGVNILDNAELTIVFSEDLMSEWTPNSGSLKQITDNAFLVTGETVELSSVPVTEISLLYNFLTRRNASDDIFKNHISQYIVSGEEEDVISTLSVQIEKPARAANEMFTANAGNDTAILIGTNASLHATQINENATYRWYDKQRNLLHEGLNYTMTPTQSASYILEVTAESDGYRDLDSVTVAVVPGCIRSINPNPATTDYVNVAYEYTTTTTSAQLYIYNTGTTTLVGSYNISNNGNVASLDIDVSNYPAGSYTVVLVCDNVICHSKILIIQ